MKKRYLLACFLICSSLEAAEPVEKDFLFQEEPLIKGLVLVKKQSDIDPSEISKIRGLDIRGIAIPGNQASLREKIAREYVGKPLNRDNLLAMKQEILSYYKANHRPLVIIEIPDQEISHGVLLFIVHEATADKIYTKGNKWFSDKEFLKSMHIKKGDEIDEEVLLNDVAWMNKNPFHYTDATLAPGSKTHTTNIELVTKERFPFRPFVGGDNSGNSFSGNTRLYAGFNWGNAFGIGDLLSYQFTSSNDFHKFLSHYVNYTSFLPWQNTLSFFGGYAHINPTVTDFRTSGDAYQASVRYSIPIKPLYTPFKQNIDVGFDFKDTNTILFFVGELNDIPVQQQRINLTQLVATYTLEDTLNKHDIAFEVDAYWSPGQWLPHQSNADYNRLREHAKNSYFYTYISLSETYHMPMKFSFGGLLRLQVASGTLIPSESFGLGGYDTVRGYQEREVIADNALCVNLELRTPPISPFRKVKNELIFHLFTDYGLGYNYHPFTDLPHVEQLISVGPGLRYSIRQNLAARVDYGFQLHHTNLGVNRFGKVHIGIALSY